MTVRGLLLALALLFASAAVPAAAACHHYAVWHYNFPQRCGVGRVALHKTIVDPPRNDFAATRNDFSLRSPGRGPSGPAVPLPLLARNDCMGGEADELTRGRLMLRAALEAAHAH